MNDLEHELRDLLEHDAEHVPAPFAPPSDLRRRVRRRQATSIALGATGGVALVLAIALTLGVLAPLGGHAPRPGDTTPTGDTTSTVNGVTITYPASWSLLQLTDDVTVGEGNVGPTGAITGHAVLQLSNVEAGLDTCPGPLVQDLPSGAVVLYVQQLDWPRVPGLRVPDWPVEPGGPVHDPQPVTCEASFPHYVAWTVAGASYEAFLAGSGPDYERLVRAFDTMSFSVPTYAFPTTGDGIPPASPIAVLASGVANGQPWNLVTYASGAPIVPSRVCIDLEVAGTFQLEPQCDLDIAAQEQVGGDMLGAEGASAGVVGVPPDDTPVTYAWGAVARSVETLTVNIDHGDGTVLDVERRDLPSWLGVSFQAFVTVTSGSVDGDVESTIGGNQTGALPMHGEQIVGSVFAPPVDAVPVVIGTDQLGAWGLMVWRDAQGEACVGDMADGGGGPTCRSDAQWRGSFGPLVIEGTSQRKPPYPQYTFAWGRVSDDVASVNVLRDPGAPSDVRIVAPPPGFEVLGRLVAIHYDREQPARVDALAPNGDVVSEVSIG